MAKNEKPTAGIPDINQAVTSLKNLEERKSLIALLRKAGLADSILQQEQGIQLNLKLIDNSYLKILNP